MNCRFCKEYLGFNDNVLCKNKHCISLKIIMEKITIKKIVEILKENLDGI
jgi:hypothetical protein